MKYGILVALLAVLLTGCLSVETTIDLKRDGGGSVDLVYTIDADLYNLGVFDDSDVALPIPISRDEFRATARRISGLALRRYRVREDDTSVTVTARLRFDNIAALNAWYGSDDAVRVTETADGTLWRQLLSPGTGADGPYAEALGQALGNYALQYRLRAPSDILAVSGGVIESDGKTAEVTITLSDVVMMTEPTYWEVRW